MIYKCLSVLFGYLKDNITSRGLIFRLAVNDFKTKYLGSYLGLIWAFIQPLVTVGVFWFVFQVGFKSQPSGDTPFIIWLLCGIIPWFYFADVLANGTNSIHEYSFLVKKMVFKTNLLPSIKIVSALPIHIFFVTLIFICLLYYGYDMSIYNIQLVYYFIAMIMLLQGLTWITSALNIFTKDIGQLVAIIIQFGFWITPIFWSIDMMPKQFKMIISLNPMYYITNGYRDSVINHIWFWDKLPETIFFWCVVLVFMMTGAGVFYKLRNHFADVM